MSEVFKPIYGEIWANAGEVLAPGNDKIATGWIQEMMPYQYENYLQNRTDVALSYLLQKGIAEWSADQEYTANKSVVTYGGQLYMATATVTNILPTVAASWKKLSATFGANGAIPIAFGGTGATTATDARTNLGIGSAATVDLPTTNGIVTKLANNSLVARTITGTAGYITVTNGDAVSGNPSITVGENVAKTDADAAWSTKTSIKIPSGTSSERGVGAPGRIRFNMESGVYEGYDNTGWNPIGSTGTLDVQNFSGDGVKTSFTMPTTPRAENNTQVYFNGVYQQKNSYNLVGSDLVFDEAPALGIEIEVVTVSSVAIGTTTAAQTSIVDSGNYYNSTNVEGALQQVGGTLNKAILFFPDFASAAAAAATLPEGQVVEAPDADGRASRFKALTGTLVFVEFANALAQAVGFTETADPEVFKALLLDTRYRQIKLKPGNYNFNGQTLLIRGRNHATGGGEVGEFFVDMTGVNLSGTGLILIDSSKKVRISGLRAPGWDIEYRGVWWTVLENIQFRDHIMGRLGASFSNNYWNYGFNVIFQRVLVPDDAVGVNNSFEWAGTMRGDDQQGFISTRAIAFELLGNVNCQHWRFRGDISYHSQAVYVVGAGNTTGDVELEMDGYFDSVIPLTYNRAGVKIIANGHHANGAGLNISHDAATRNAYRLERSDRSLIHNPASGVNQVVNGDLAITVPLGHPLLPVLTDASVSASFIAGNSAASRSILQVTRSSGGSVFFRTLQALTTGRYTGRWVLRLPDGSGPRSIQFRVGSRYFTTNISDTQWHVVTLTEETPIASGVAPTLTFNAIDNSPITINFAYIGLTYGAGGAMYERPIQPQTLIGELVTAVPTTAATNTALITVPCQDARFGDFVQWSCSVGVGTWLVSANIAAANEVRIYLRNNSASDQSIPSATWRVKVTKAGT